jgi:HSP20 family protein
MAVDLVEHDENLIAKIELPGFTSEEVAVRVTDRTLEIDAEREAATEDADESYIKRERRHKSMHRSIRLPREIDSDRATAQMKNGMLTLTLPKLQVEEAKLIDIE